jgi:RimJ/RimL family protein N-acetyltransferase
MLSGQLSSRPLNPDDLAAILDLQRRAIAALSGTASHFLKKRDETYLRRVLDRGIGVGIFDASAGDRLVAHLLLRWQNQKHYEPNCNVNNFLLKRASLHNEQAKLLINTLREQSWGVLGSLLLAPEPAYQKRGLARALVAEILQLAAQAGEHHLFASTALENLASQKVFSHFGFTPLAEAQDPRDGWRCVILHHSASPEHEPIRWNRFAL